MVRDYELMYIVRPELDDEALQAATQSVEQLITAAGGEVTESTSWGRRRLAYEVKHLRDGHYMLLQLRLDGAQVAGVERALTISETVFRHLLVLQEAPALAENGAAAAEAEDDGATATRQAPVAAAPDDGAEPDQDGDSAAGPAAADDDDGVAGDDDEEEDS